MNKHTENQVAAMLRRMDAYLYGESSEATAIIKDARELLDVCRAVGIQQEQLIMRYEAQQPSGVPEEPNIDKGCLIVARDAIEFEKCQAHKQGYKQGYQQGRKDAAAPTAAAQADHDFAAMTARGAIAWAGVDAQELRAGGAAPAQSEDVRMLDWAEDHLISCQDSTAVDAPKRWKVEHSGGTHYGITLLRAIRAAMSAQAAHHTKPGPQARAL